MFFFSASKKWLKRERKNVYNPNFYRIITVEYKKVILKRSEAWFPQPPTLDDILLNTRGASDLNFSLFGDIYIYLKHASNLFLHMVAQQKKCLTNL